MSYIYYPPTDCDDAAEHFCNVCDQIELGRVRGVAFIKKTFTFTNPSSAAEWTAGILSGDIIVIPETTGTYDGGTPKEGTAFGDQEFRTTGYSYTLQFKDPNYKQNRDFYNSIQYSRNYNMAFRTETQIHLSNKPVSISVQDPVTEDLNAEVTWNVTAKWASQSLMTIEDMPLGIFDRCAAVDA